MRNSFFKVLLFVLFFSTSIHIPVQAATTSPTTSNLSVDAFVDMFDIDDYTAATPYVVVSGHSASITFTTDQPAKISLHNDVTTIKTKDYVQDQEITVSLLQETNTFVLTVTTESGATTTHSITIKTAAKPKHKVMPKFAETSITSPRRSHY
ncbi:hypothetical protein HCJ07_08600 [Listeria booriae]|uniref:hypothetical protein n=1 Tax=Listeria booriae TaxID=1552123 RepID=UPI0016297601|nr:hypothetical protein [Listeria booriae]MBC1530407.1 hypothetical protein [Listeria booriae]